MSITYRKATIDDIKIVTELTLLLYSDDNTFDSLYEENQNLLKNSSQAIFLAFDDKKTIGMADCCLRTEYVEGTSGGNIGYLEGIFVLPEYRLRGIAKSLVMLCEDWSSEQGCKEFASDCELTNTDSYLFHLKIGFQEANRIICFTKTLWDEY